MPTPTAAEIAAAQAQDPEPLEIHDGKMNRVEVHVGRRVRIRVAPGENQALTIAFPGELPFVDESPDPGRQRPTNAPFRTSRRGKFPFNCFLGGKQLTSAGYAGEIEVGPEI